MEVAVVASFFFGFSLSLLKSHFIGHNKNKKEIISWEIYYHVDNLARVTWVSGWMLDCSESGS
jgi:hypothetical protein